MSPFSNLHSIIKWLEKRFEMLIHGRVLVDRTVPFNINEV